MIFNCQNILFDVIITSLETHPIHSLDAGLDRTIAGVAGFLLPIHLFQALL
jgi:hypothetical protein